MRVDVRPRKRNAPRPAEKSCPKYLQWLRGRECLISRIAQTHAHCGGKLEAAHTYGAGDKGIGTKSNDCYAIPLCNYCHARQHSMGWKSFEKLYGFDAPSMAEAYFNEWPGRHAWRRKQEAGA